MTCDFFAEHISVQPTTPPVMEQLVEQRRGQPARKAEEVNRG